MADDTVPVWVGERVKDPHVLAYISRLLAELYARRRGESPRVTSNEIPVVKPREY